MADNLCIFEDDQSGNLLPLTYVRPTYDLRCGMTTLREKIVRAYPAIPLRLSCRPYLSDLVREQNPGIPVNSGSPGRTLFVNGRLLADSGLAKRIRLKGNDLVFLSGETVVAARVSDANLGGLERALLTGILSRESFSGFPHEVVEEQLVRYPWDLVASNGAALLNDFKLFASKKKLLRGKIYAGVDMVGKRNIYVETGARIKPGVVLDAENGPIVIGKNVYGFPSCDARRTGVRRGGELDQGRREDL